MKEVKKFTCLTDEGDAVEGAIEGTKKQVIAWMKKTFPGIHKAADQERTPAWLFFCDMGESTVYETPEGKNLYLIEA